MESVGSDEEMLINVEMMGPEAVSAHPSHLGRSEFLAPHLPSVHTSGAPPHALHITYEMAAP